MTYVSQFLAFHISRLNQQLPPVGDLFHTDPDAQHTLIAALRMFVKLYAITVFPYPLTGETTETSAAWQTFVTDVLHPICDRTAVISSTAASPYAFFQTTKEKNQFVTTPLVPAMQTSSSPGAP
jgi:hypothetical protein